jgi:hypothetical protein
LTSPSEHETELFLEFDDISFSFEKKQKNLATIFFGLKNNPIDYAPARLCHRVARLFSVQHTKTGEKCTKRPQNVPNGHQIYHLAVDRQNGPKNTNIIHCMTLQNLPKFEFLV